MRKLIIIIVMAITYNSIALNQVQESTFEPGEEGWYVFGYDVFFENPTYEKSFGL
jgi:hypothetical protein